MKINVTRDDADRIILALEHKAAHLRAMTAAQKHPTWQDETLSVDERIARVGDDPNLTKFTKSAIVWNLIAADAARYAEKDDNDGDDDDEYDEDDED